MATRFGVLVWVDDVVVVAAVVIAVFLLCCDEGVVIGRLVCGI